MKPKILALPYVWANIIIMFIALVTLPSEVLGYALYPVAFMWALINLEICYRYMADIDELFREGGDA